MHQHEYNTETGLRNEKGKKGRKKYRHKLHCLGAFCFVRLYFVFVFAFLQPYEGLMKEA
jgi:hypothetical protein